MAEARASIQNVSDTAIWVAMYRAYESERPDALFHDPYARRLAGPNGEAIVRSIPRGRGTSWPMVVRTVAFDEFVLRAVREGADTVLDLATGLDSRPWRLELPASLRWIDVDLPGILGAKQSELANETPRCRYEARAVDLRDESARRALFADVGATSRRAFVLTEGLLIYLEPEAVAALARDLAAQTAFRGWAFDLMSPELLARLQRTWGKTLSKGNAPFHFAPAEGTRFFAPYGWREREFRSTWLDAKRLGRRMSGAWIFDLIMAMSPKRRREEAFRYAGNVVVEPLAG